MHDHTAAHCDRDRLYTILLDLRHWADARGLDFNGAGAVAYDLYETQTNRKAGNCPVTAPETPGIKPWAMPETESEDTDNEF